MLGIGRSESIARFEGFELDLRSAELRKPNGITIRLSEQPLRILIALLERPGELVLREDLRKRLWPNDTIVEFEHSISAAMNRLRQALGDSAESPKLIETLARRGYRWKTPVTWDQPQAASAAAPRPANGNLVGKKISHYRVLQVVGGGGMGVVYKAEDIKLGRSVALKFLPEELAGDTAAMQRFEREARAASALNHPNICTIHAVEEHDGQPFIVMELLEGRTLRDVVADCANSNSTLPMSRLLDIAIQIVQGLEAAHRKGIIHRDIKPANIFITNHGGVKILDFGLAKLHQLDTAEAERQELTQPACPREWNPLLTLTRTGTTVGTAAYMSPEQVRGEKLDVRTDLFSFGLVLYEMATRQRAFDGDSAPVLHQAILNEGPRPVRELNPAIPSKVEFIVKKAIQKERAARYQNAFDIGAELQKLKAEMEPRGRWWIGAAIVMLLLVFAGLWFAERNQRSLAPAPGLKLRQLTSNSYENRVTDGRISPDGKYLVYIDGAGMHLKIIETNETHTIPQPELLRRKKMVLTLADAAWSRDSTKLLANAHPDVLDVATVSEADVIKGGGLSIWEFLVPSGRSQMLREMAWADSYSPDGSLISFNANKGRYGPGEIWLMDSNGQHPRKILDGGDEYGIDTFLWSPDGRRVSYIRHNESTFETISLAWERDHLGKDLSGKHLGPLFGTKEVFDGVELPDGRAIISVRNGASGSDTCDFWTVHVDPRTGTPMDKPVQLTHWPGFCMSQISFTADGKRLAFLEWASHSHTTVDVAELHDGGTRVSNLRHFTLSDSTDWPCDWTPDSNILIFHSNRDGHDGNVQAVAQCGFARAAGGRFGIPGMR